MKARGRRDALPGPWILVGEFAPQAAWQRIVTSAITVARIRAYWGQLGQYLKDRGPSQPQWALGNYVWRLSIKVVTAGLRGREALWIGRPCWGVSSEHS